MDAAGALWALVGGVATLRNVNITVDGEHVVVGETANGVAATVHAGAVVVAAPSGG